MIRQGFDGAVGKFLCDRLGDVVDEVEHHGLAEFVDECDRRVLRVRVIEFRRRARTSETVPDDAPGVPVTSPRKYPSMTR